MQLNNKELLKARSLFGGKPGGSGGVQPDWSQCDETAPDYVKNRTHYEAEEIVNEPLNITWDGNTEGLVSVAPFYKVSDTVLTDEQIKSATVVFDDETIAVGDMFDTMAVVSEELVVSEIIGFCQKAGATFNNFTFPEIGIYFVSIDGMYVSSLTTTEPVEQTKTVVHKLDKKYLPDDIGGGGGGGGVETVYLFRTPEDTARIIEEIIYDEKGRMKQLSYGNTLEISKQFADDLYQKWVEGKTRVIIVTMTGLVAGGADSVGTLISLNKAALDETGKSWEMYAQIIYGREIKSIRIC